jgi:ABC-2 type transport system permease protein
VRNVTAIAWRELGAYFGSFLAYLVIALFMVVNGFFFYLNVSFGQQATIGPVVQTIFTILLLITPILTMRLVSEELRSGTVELLLTAPVRDVEVAAGKFLAGLGFVGVMLVLTLAYPATLALLGSPDWGVVGAAYLGMVLFAGGAMAVGLFASSVTPNQIVAAVLAFVILLVLWVIDGLSSSLGGTLGDAVREVALYPHFSDLTRGLINSKDIVYFLSLIVFGVFLSTTALEARRWRG